MFFERKRKAVTVTPGSEWSSAELDFFKIQIHPEKEFSGFFMEEPPTEFTKDIRDIVDIDMSGAGILETIDWGAIPSRQVARFVKHVLAVTSSHKNIETVVQNFGKILFEILDYDVGDLCIHTREELTLDMCGYRTSANPDICIENSRLTVKMLVREDRSYRVSASKNVLNSNSEAQVIAEAIAAFQENNKLNQRFDLPEQREQLMPCVTMLGTYPTFYLFPVTKALSDAVRVGEEPENVTRIMRYKIHMLSLPLGDAMLIQKHKKHILQCYIALRKFVVDAQIE